MGWKLKGAGVLLALLFLAASLWPLTLLIFAALIIPPLLRRSDRNNNNGNYNNNYSGNPGQPGRSGSRGRSGGFPVRKVVGVLLIILSFVAFVEGGTLSPWVFGGLGVLVLWGNQIPGFSIGGSLKPVKSSILLRGRWNPFGWTAVAEVKPMTRDLGRALSGLAETIVVTASGTPSIRIALHRTALSEKSAEESMLVEMEKINRGIVPVGAYLLPLDSAQAAQALQVPLQSTPVSEDGWALGISTGPYDVVSIRPEKGFADSLGLYRRVPAEEVPSPAVPNASKRFKHPPLLWEVFKGLEGRMHWPNPDRYTAFLSSIYATSYEPHGSNIIDAGTVSPTSETVVVKSHSSPAVELSRTQLRAIMRIYSQGPPVVVENREPIIENRQPMMVPEAVPEAPEAVSPS
jgi:hypothetical protein